MPQQELDDLTQEVTDTVGVEESAKALIDGFAARLAAAGTDPAKLSALRSSLKSASDDLAAAVAANQEPAPEPPVQ